MMRFAIVLMLALAATWWVLSGFGLEKTLLLILGAISIVLVLIMSARMRILDRETAPYLTIPQTLAYFGWLFKEIVKANVQVVNAVMAPDLEVSPTLVKIRRQVRPVQDDVRQFHHPDARYGLGRSGR